MKNSTIDKEFKKVKAENFEKNNNFENGKNGIVSKIFTTLFALGTIGIIIVLFLLYGPYSGFREWLVTTAMTTMTHQYFATWFYDDDTIQDALNKNRVQETDEITDTDIKEELEKILDE